MHLFLIAMHLLLQVEDQVVMGIERLSREVNADESREKDCRICVSVQVSRMSNLVSHLIGLDWKRAGWLFGVF